MREGTSASDKQRRQRVWRAVRTAVFVAALALCVAAPVLAAVGPTSSSTYVFAPTGAQGAAGLWKSTAQVVSITASPTVDATVTAHFSSDNGLTWATKSAPSTQTATLDFAVTAEGSNPVRYYASDTSGNPPEPEKAPGFVNIDRTTPAFTHVGGLEASATTGWSQATTRTVTLTATDVAPAPGTAISGMKEITYSINGGPAETTQTSGVVFVALKGSGGVVEGNNLVAYSAKDWAGNAKSATGYINIDTVAPSTTPSPALPTTDSTGWVALPVTVTLSWQDVSSGVPTGGTVYRVDDGNPTIYVSPFTVSAEGSTKLSYRSVDRAGNVETTQTAYVNIDASAPTASATTSPAGSSGWYNTDVVVSIVGEDAVSGIGGSRYRKVPATDWITAAGNQFTVAASDNAVESFEFQALDKAGNASTVGTIELKMDSTKPQAYGKNASGKVNKPITLKYRLTDNLSPKAQAIYVNITKSNGDVVKKQKISGQKNMGTWYSFSWKPSKKGTYKYYVHGSDLATNTSKTKAATITVK